MKKSRFVWTQQTGSWGKRNPVDYMNEYTGYGDADNYQAYFFPPGKTFNITFNVSVMRACVRVRNNICRRDFIWTDSACH